MPWTTSTAAPPAASAPTCSCQAAARLPAKAGRGLRRAATLPYWTTGDLAHGQHLPPPPLSSARWPRAGASLGKTVVTLSIRPDVPGRQVAAHLQVPRSAARTRRRSAARCRPLSPSLSLALAGHVGLHDDRPRRQPTRAEQALGEGGRLRAVRPHEGDDLAGIGPTALLLAASGRRQPVRWWPAAAGRGKLRPAERQAPHVRRAAQLGQAFCSHDPTFAMATTGQQNSSMMAAPARPQHVVIPCW